MKLFRDGFKKIFNKLILLFVLILSFSLFLLFQPSNDKNYIENEIDHIDYVKILQLKIVHSKCNKGIKVIEESLLNDNKITAIEYKNIKFSFLKCDNLKENVDINKIKQQLLSK